MRWGFKFQLGAFWLGYHYSPANKRICINVIPFCTLWIAFKGGRTPSESRGNS